MLSFIYPVPIRRGHGDYNNFLEVLLYCNQLQLATNDALYSDGDRYRPASATINNLKSFLPAIHKVLVLGTGLGSMIRVLRSKGCDPQCTLVEIDKVVLSWAMEFLEESKAGKVTPVCSDAKVFMAQNKAKFDLVFIDVFNGRVVPEFVYSELFLEQCRAGLEPGGYVAFNYMINDNEEWEIVKTTFTGIFPSNQILNIGINRILIGRIS